jgi:hypothetical protein
MHAQNYYFCGASNGIYAKKDYFCGSFLKQENHTDVEEKECEAS